MKFLAIVALLALSGCSTVQNLFSTQPEDLSAIRTTVLKQQEALDLAFDLHKLSLQQMHDMGLDEANGRITQAKLDEIHTAAAALTGAALADKLAMIDVQEVAERKLSKDAWDKALAAGTEPQAWKDLRMLTTALKTYLNTRLDADANKNDLVTTVSTITTKSTTPTK